MPYFRPIAATPPGQPDSMLTMRHDIAMQHAIPPDELPATPDEIDLERVVHDPDYRAAVKELLRRWAEGVAGGRTGPS